MHPTTPRTRRVLGVCLALAACAWLALPAAAEDAPADPEKAYAEAVSKLPEPSKEAGFFFQGVLRIEGKVMGYARFAASPAHAEDAAWVAGDHFVMKGKAVDAAQSSQAWLDRKLVLLRGQARSNRPGAGEITWTRSADGFLIEQAIRAETKDGATAEDRQRAVPHKGTALNTMAATVLFCRMMLPAKATYRTSILEPETAMKGDLVKDPQPALLPVDLEVLGEQDFQGTKVLAVRGRKEDKELTVLFHAKTRDVVAMRLVEGKTTLQILPGDVWVMPALDPVTAGMKALLGFAAKELRILDHVIHWETLYAGLREGKSEEDLAKLPDIETWRKALLAQWGKRPQGAPAAMMKQLIASQKALVKQEDLGGGRFKLTFPEMLRGTQFIVAAVDGVWHVVGFPSKAKPAPKKDAPEKAAPKKAAPPKGEPEGGK